MNLTFAERLLQSYGITEPEEIDLAAIAYDQGATIKYRALRGCEARIIGVGNRAIISVRGGSRPERQRFSIGHELGHWVQDKGRIATACVSKDIRSSNVGLGPEGTANAFASQLLLPDYLFKPLTTRLPPTFESVRPIASRFRTSLTSTAIKFIQVGYFPAVVAAYQDGRYAWHFRGPDVPTRLALHKELDSDSLAFDLLRGNGSRDLAMQSADTWIDCEGAEDYELYESSILAAPGVTVSMLWWKDEAQLRDLRGSAQRPLYNADR